jgi:hypothetical protein
VVLALAQELDIPLREQNKLLLAAGHAPAFPERTLADPNLESVREAVDLILTGHEPYPALVVDRHWNVVAANTTMRAISRLIDPVLREPPVNAMRAGLHPRGLAQWITNLQPVYGYFVRRLEHQVAVTADPVLVALLDEVRGYRAAPDSPHPAAEAAAGHIVTPIIQLRGPDGTELALFGTVASFGTATEVTSSELSIELAFPADATSAAVLRALSA